MGALVGSLAGGRDFHGRHQNGGSCRIGMTDQQPSLATPAAAAGSQTHDFELQKRLHQKIRNDADYDDWDYGTEPLPNEAWIKPPSPASEA